MADPTKLPPPLFLTRRRVIIACTNCRRRKIRCLTAEDPPSNPCDRCIKKGLKCEYITITNQREDSSTNRAAPREAEPLASESSYSPPSRDPRMNVANSSGPLGSQFDAHPRVAFSNPNPSNDHRLVPSGQYQHSRYPNQRAEHSYLPLVDGYNLPHPSTSFPRTMQPHPYHAPPAFTPLVGVSPERPRELGQRARRRRNVNLSELPQTALVRTGTSTAYRSDHELEAEALMRIWMDSIKFTKQSVKNPLMRQRRGTLRFGGEDTDISGTALERLNFRRR
ncbi:hypothetical protein B0H13DRAFT_1866742 [Mycena leptocephala]|nr:hypothetical protein B0H13DRAFT_1866742 [Mycena leptocephala]